MKNYQTFRNVYYFPSFGEALAYATQNNWPSDRIIHYTRGWAIQLKVSGPYVGPTSEGERRHSDLMAAGSAMITYLATKLFEYACYAVIFGGIAFGWIATTSGIGIN